MATKRQRAQREISLSGEKEEDYEIDSEFETD